MTSTNFNIGFTEETRNSSRVLKPPGGGHTDIFGIHDPQDKQEGGRRPTKKHTTSSVGSLFAADEEHVNEEVPVEQNGVENVEQVKPISDENIKPVPVPTRVRVPPGGFSSGLW